MARCLTSFFGSYSVGQYNKKKGKNLMSILSLSPLDLEGLAEYILLGNKQLKDIEGAYAKLDDYLSISDERSPFTAWLDLVGEYDSEFHIFGTLGIKYSEFKDSVLSQFGSLGDGFFDTLNESGEKLEDAVNSIVDGASLTPAVDEPSNLGDVDTVDTVDA